MLSQEQHAITVVMLTAYRPETGPRPHESGSPITGLLVCISHELVDDPSHTTWLILPVVICLFQRLSHACLSIRSRTAKLRMAHYNSYSLLDNRSLHGYP